MNIKREFSSVEELLAFMKANDVFKIDVLTEGDINSFVDGTEQTSKILLVERDGSASIVISETMFNEYYSEIKDYYIGLVKKDVANGLKQIKIPDIALDYELIDFLKENYDKLTDVEFELVDFEHFKYFFMYAEDLIALNLRIKKDGNYISPVFEEMVTPVQVFELSSYSNNIIFNFFESNSGDAVIYLASDGVCYDERSYISRLLDIFRVINDAGKKYNVRIDVANRELLMRSGLLDFSNINLTINDSGVIYSREEFLAEDAILEELVKPIRAANLSPLPRYIAAYDVVKTYRDYCRNRVESIKNSHLKYVLDKTNSYIACGGYANLLTAVLNKLDIGAYKNSLDVDVSRDSEFIEGDEPWEGHGRNIVKIDDDEYNIHGIYEGDATWDNHHGADFYYNYVAMTFDRVKELKRFETLTDEDLLLDFHDLDDFREKINYFLVINVRSSRRSHDTNCQTLGVNIHFNEEAAYVKALKYLYIRVLDIFRFLDYDAHLSWYTKYNSEILGVIVKYEAGLCNFDEVLEVFKQFLREYYNYIILLSNKKISNDVLDRAILEVRKKVNGLSEEDALDDVATIRYIADRDEADYFPYVFNPKDSGSVFHVDLDNPDNNVRPNYLDERKRKRS